MLQNDVLENGIFKPRPKLAESTSKQARLAPSQLVGDGGAVARRSGRLQLSVRRYDHSERSEPEGVMPPFRYKGLESNSTTYWGIVPRFISPIAMGRRPISFGHISPRCTSQEWRYLILAFYTERGASHLRGRSSVDIFFRCFRPGLRPTTSSRRWTAAASRGGGGDFIPSQRSRGSTLPVGTS